MRVSDAIDLIRFDTGTLADISGKAVNNLFTNKVLLQQLMRILNRYANYTKAIEDIYSFSLNTNTPFVTAPSLALRSEAYRGILVVINGRIFMGDIQGLANTYTNFPMKSFQGITTWMLPYGSKDWDRLYVFPLNATTPHSTTLTADVTATATTLPVASSDGFITHDGRVTIDSEKILYGRKDSTNFYDCVRGVESTTAASHLSAATVTEHNVYLFYSRLHTNLRAINDDYVDKATMDFEFEVCEEHMDGIVALTTYMLMLKVDRERAKDYKIDGDELMTLFKTDIRKGRSRMRQGTNIRYPYMSESGQPMYTNLM